MKPLRYFASVLFAAAGTAAFAQTPPPAQPSPADGKLQYANGIVAIVEDRIITVADVMRRVGPLMEQARNQAKDQKDFEETVARLQDNMIQQLIDEVLMVKEFRKDEKRHIPASYIDNAIADEKAERFDNDQSKYLAYLKAQGKTKREYRRDKEEDIITSYMQSQQRRSQSIVSPVRIETFYKENKSEFYRDDEVHVRMISLPRAEGDTDASLKEKADKILERFKAGEKFEDLAREFNQGPYRSNGGDYKWMQRSSFAPEFRDAAFNLKKGEASAPIVLSAGCYIIYAEDRHFAGIQPLDEVRTQIENILVGQMTRTSQERFLERLRRNGYIKLY